MNDSKDFQDAESVRSGNSHVTSRPVSFPPHPIPEGMLRHSFITVSRREGPPSIWDTQGFSGNFFVNPDASIISTLSTRTASVEFITRRAAPFIHSGEKWKANTRSRSEMPVWTVSQKFSHPQWRRLFKELWGRPTTTADFGSSFRNTSHVCLLEDKIQDWDMYLLTIPYGSNAMDQRSEGGWFSGWFKNLHHQYEVFQCLILKYLMRGLLQHLTESSIILTSKEESVWRNLKAQKQDRFLRGRQIAYFIYEYFRVTGIHWFCRKLCRPVHYQSSKWRYSGIRFKVGRKFIVYDENPTWWHLGRIVQIKNTTVWETQDCIGIVQPGGSSEESRTWLSQIEDTGEKKYRAGNSK